MLSVFLEITRKCNLQCIFCSNPVSRMDELTTQHFIALIDELIELGLHDLRLYGGEPLLHPDVFQITKAARIRNIPVSIYSNGTIMDEHIIQELIVQRIRKLFLSVDSPNQLTHDKIRGKKGALNLVLNTIQMLTTHKILVDVLVTICKINKNDINDIYPFLIKLGVADIKVNFVSNVGKAKERWDELALSMDEVRECMFIINEMHLKYFGRSPIRKPCQAGTGELFIAYNGDVYPCALFLQPEYKAGNVTQRSLNEIWNEPEGLLLAIRETTKESKYCSNCSKKTVCMGGCRARAAAMNKGNLASPDIGSCILHKEILK